VLACLAALSLYARPVWAPVLIQDDFQILEQSWTWERTREGLWRPHNEHFMPLGRLLAYGLVCLGGGMTAMPRACALVGPLALVAGMLLVYAFVRRELDGQLYGVVAMTLFGVSCVYQQAVWWFAASFSVLALDTLLLALLAAQRWRQSGRACYLWLAALACLLAPGWFASGVLAGPCSAVYLLPQRLRTGWRAWLAVLVPLAGTALALVVIVPMSAPYFQHLEHYQGRKATEVFDPITGLAYTGRSVVDNLLCGLLGASGLGITTPWPVAAGVLLVVAGGAVWWWHQAPRGQLLRLGTALLLGSYWLTYSARASWPYEQYMTALAWTRYHLLPQLGLALIVAGGLPGRSGRWFMPLAGGVTRSQSWGLGLLIVICWLVQLRGLILLLAVFLLVQVRGPVLLAVLCWLLQSWGYFVPYLAGDPHQAAMLRRIEDTDDRCRHYLIGADAARQALDKLSLAEWASEVNGWTFLRGSDDPQPRSRQEIRRLLQD
jgi:hypothetical protein